MKKQDAVGYYTAVPKVHNCAQAVACGAGCDARYDEFKAYGGGRAPEGRCGALHAALELVPAEHRDAVIAEFVAATGSPSCSTIKSLRFPCAECVKVAAELIEKYR